MTTMWSYSFSYGVSRLSCPISSGDFLYCFWPPKFEERCPQYYKWFLVPEWEACLHWTNHIFQVLQSVVLKQMRKFVLTMELQHNYIWCLAFDMKNRWVTDVCRIEFSILLKCWLCWLGASFIDTKSSSKFKVLEFLYSYSESQIFSSELALWFFRDHWLQ